MRIKFLAAIVALAGFVGFTQPREARAFSGEIFEIAGSGKLFHFEGGAVPGVKPPVTNLNMAAIIACIRGLAGGCGGTLENSLVGKAYLYLDSDTSWRIATTPDCDDTLTVLEGVVGGDGTFMMAGHHELSDTRFVIQGKVKFAPGTLTPVGISGASVLATSDDQAHYGTGTFHTVGAALPNSCP